MGRWRCWQPIFLPLQVLKKYRAVTYWTIVGYTLLTIVLWIILGDKTFRFETTSALGYYAKTAETFLLVFLGHDLPRYLPAKTRN